MMARRAGLLLLVACGSCMEMRETVERMVMVRRTGSDLQPAATGFIYKKDNDGPVNVIKMDESDVMEHLAKVYEQPKAFAAPIPVAAGPFYAKEDENKAASHASEAYVIPVVEKLEDEDDKGDDHVDGIADADYSKIFKDYASDLGNYNNDFADYVHSLGHYDLGIYHGDGGGSDYGFKGHHEDGDKGQEGYASAHDYGKGGEGDYHTEKYESYSISKEGSHKNHYGDADAFGKLYDQGKGYSGGDRGHKASHSKEGAVDGFHKLFNKDEYKKDHDFHDEEGVKGGFNKHGDGHEYHGSDAGGYEKGGSHESGHDEGDFGKGGYQQKQSGDEHGAAHSSEEGDDSYHHHSREGGAESEQDGGKVYSYEVKH